MRFLKMTDYFREVYRKLIPFRLRDNLYYLRHRKEYNSIRNKLNVHDGKNYSIRSFDKGEFIFVHVPKAAGTSVSRAIGDDLILHYTALEYRRIFGKKDFDDYYKFAIVRNPWDRLYSAYSFLKSGGWNAKDKRWFDDNISKYENFESFVSEWVTAENVRSYIHFLPQCDFLCDRRGVLLVDFIGRFESIDRDFSLVAEKIGIADNGLKKENQTKKRIGDYREVYTDKTASIVGEVYARDCNLLNYSF